MAYAALGVLLVVLLIFAARWYANAQPSTLWQVFKWTGITFVGLLGTYLAVTGRLGMALFAAPMLYPIFTRLRQAWRMGKRFSGGGPGGIGSTGQTSEVRTRFVRMVLDHDTGEMNGDVLQGRFAGRTLRNLALPDLAALLEEAKDDPDSVQVLTAYLDRYHGDEWRDAGKTEAGGAPRAGTMSREEAFEILGLSPGADEAAIKVAYHKLMSKIHPDLGGSTYLAAKINQAKDVLLGS